MRRRDTRLNRSRAPSRERPDSASRERQSGVPYERPRTLRGHEMERGAAIWEGQRLSHATGGAAHSHLMRRSDKSTRDYKDVATDDDDGPQVQLVFLRREPEFLHTDGAEEDDAAAQPVLDPASDLAQAARRGSALVDKIRERKERGRQLRELAGSGTVLGGIVGAQEEEAENAALTGHWIDATSGTNTPISTAEVGANVTLRNEELPANAARFENAVEPVENDAAIAQQREELPISACRRQIVQLVRENQVVVLVGETGSGKTTQLPQYLLADGLCGRGRGALVCTQPRRVAAIGVARRVAREMDCALGTDVGYAVRFDDNTSAQTYIKFATDGVLLREVLRDAEMEKYSVVVVDEAHERTLQTDVLLGVLRRLLARRRDLRLVVMSATLDAERFAAFFGGAPVFTVRGRTFPVEILHTRSQPADFVEEAVRQVVRIHLTLPPGDILVFLSGQDEIETACASIRERLHRVCFPNEGATRSNPSDDNVNVESSSNDAFLGETESARFHRDAHDGRLKVGSLALLPMYAALPAEAQAAIFARAPTGVRRCVVATNIAETSLTLSGVRYVVDAGVAKVRVYSARAGLDALQTYPISRAAAAQRAGRAGRTAPGTCFRLYTQAAYEREMLPAAVPEVQRANLAAVVLMLASLGVRDAATFDFIDAPRAGALRAAQRQLWMLGALHGSTGALTPIGRAMAALPLDPPLARMLLSAAPLGCTEEALGVAAMLSAPPVFYRPRERAREADAARERLLVPGSDHLTLLFVFEQWMSSGCSDRWCSAHFVHARALRRAADIRAQLAQQLSGLLHGASLVLSVGSPLLTQRPLEQGNFNSRKEDGFVQKSDEVERFCHSLQHPLELKSHAIHWCIAAAGADRLAKLCGPGEYADVRTGAPCGVHATSALHGLSDAPDLVVYHELVLTTQAFMRCATAVDPVWMAQACPQQYALRVTPRAPGGTKLSRVIEFSFGTAAIQALRHDTTNIALPEPSRNIISAQLDATERKDDSDDDIIVQSSRR